MKRLFLYGLMVTQLFACAFLAPLKNETDHNARATNKSAILAINQWHLLGRLSVRHAKESGLTKLDWQHSELSDELILSTSLGGVLAKLSYMDNRIIVAGSDGISHVVTEQELHSQIGYLPPLNHLKFWVRGFPNPEIDVQIQQVDSSDELSFEQDGWDVELTRFETFSAFELPTKVSLIKGGLKIKLVVDEWLD
ncbi:MAG: outer membrane lipoprotein LolB [Cycloclasticus sp.]|nr:MAG: outer membrane lipoprotein LolB [Cycloclasticus sp.]